jgi:hypothetical protein
MSKAGRMAGACGSVLMAVTVVSGGVALGSGTAAGEAIVFGSSTGSAGPTPSWLDEALDGLRPCRGREYPTSPPDAGPCYRNSDRTQVSHGECLATYFAPDEAEPGVEVEFGAQIKATESAFDVPDPENDVDVTSVTLHPPKGFEFVGLRLVAGSTPLSSGGFHTVTFDSTVEVDPTTGAITVSAPDGGWPIWPGRDSNRFDGGSVYLGFTFRAPERAEGSSHGFTFTGTNVPDSRGLVVERNIRVQPDTEGAGS